MAAKDYYFFTDTNQQASNAADYINVQTSGAYGPVVPATAGIDEYRVTSLRTATFSPTLNPTAYAVCDATVCVQRIPSNTPPLVNGILKPPVQPALIFALINRRGTALAGNNLTKSRWVQPEEEKLLLSDIRIAAGLDDQVKEHC